jgi:hypothetical protein
MALFEAYEDQIQETLRGLEEKLDKAAKMHAGVLAFPPHSPMPSTECTTASHQNSLYLWRHLPCTRCRTAHAPHSRLIPAKRHPEVAHGSRVDARENFPFLCVWKPRHRRCGRRCSSAHGPTVPGAESAKELIIAAKQDVEEAEEVLGKMEMEIRRCVHQFENVVGAVNGVGWPSVWWG